MNSRLLQRIKYALMGKPPPHTIWLENELRRHQRLLEQVARDPEAAWLYRNRAERMDATIPDLFDDSRREFHLARYRFAAKHTVSLRVADIACGTGYGSAFLKTSGNALEVCGIDIDPEAIAYAQVRHGGAGLSFFCADGTKTGLDSHSFDAVTSFETLEHLENPEALLSEFRRILKPEGILIISVPNAWSLEDAPYHRLCIATDEIQNILGRFFKETQFWAQNSGSSFKYNHNQPAGIRPLCSENFGTAECILAVCKA